MSQQRFIQIYTGNGKGKTTAAIGEVVRAIGAGFNCYFAMFMKSHNYSEISILKSFNKKIKLVQIGNDHFVFKKELPSDKLKNEILQGLEDAKNAMLSGGYDLIILDEINVSIYFKLLSTKNVLDFIQEKPKNVEIILTGRYAPDKILEKADLVTEMKEIKHYYTKGILSRKGFDS